MSEDDDFIMEEFEWILKDPTEEKLRDLMQIVNIVAKVLYEAMDELKVSIRGFDERISSLEERIASGDALTVDATSTIESATIESKLKPKLKPKPKPKPKDPVEEQTVMGELQTVLRLRREQMDASSK